MARIDGTIEWLVDDDGRVVGHKKRDGTETGIATVETNPLTGEVELIGPDGQPISVGGGAGIQPDATGTLAGRSAHDSEAVGFVYLATDQTPAEYYFREGASGNWSPSVTVKGDTGATGATGATGPAGADGANGADGADGADGAAGTIIAVQSTAPASPNINDLWVQV